MLPFRMYECDLFGCQSKLLSNHRANGAAVTIVEAIFVTEYIQLH